MWYALTVLAAVVKFGANGQCGGPYRPGYDHLELHYDMAPDPDDGHSMALDRTIIDSTFGKDGCPSVPFKKLFTKVVGTYGYKTKSGNRGTRFIEDSPGLAQTIWDDCGGFYNADANYGKALRQTARRWKEAIRKGRNVFVKEGGPSEFTADVIRRVYDEYGWLDFNPKCQVTVVQHSNWNEGATTTSALNYVKRNSNYVRISDANKYLKVVGDNTFINRFKRRASRSKFGKFWDAAFDFYPSFFSGKSKGDPVIDASDSGELMEIMGLGEMDLADCMNAYF